MLILEAGPRIDRGQSVVRFFDALIKVPEWAYPNTAYAPPPRSEDLDFYYVQSGPDKLDGDLRAFDHPNLFIQGSAVFPTVGAANPTLTIAALALRSVGAIRAALAQ